MGHIFSIYIDIDTHTSNVPVFQNLLRLSSTWDTINETDILIAIQSIIIIKITVQKYITG